MKKSTFFWLLFLFCVFNSKSQTVLTSSNLPIILINTNGQAIADDPKIVADMSVLFNASGGRNSIGDAPNHFKGKIGIEIRGQSSQGFPMKSYGLELRDATGLHSVDLPLLGLPAESDWILYAPFTDKTLMRNFLAYTIFREMGHWASNTRFVELVVNGDYQGIYVFMEKIKRVAGRLNLTKMAPTDLNGDAFTGGYIFSIDKQPNGWFSSFPTPNSTNGATRQFSYVYPQLKDIVEPQKTYLKTVVDAFEYALAGPDFQNPLTGVRKYADLSSFIDYMIVNELSHNVDGYRLSSYFHKDRDSKDPRIKAGPVWDYDLAFRNADYCDGSNTAGWSYLFNYTCPGDGAGLIPFWWERLMQDDSYKAELGCRWKSLRKTTLSFSNLEHFIDSISDLVSEAQYRHFKRWPILGTYVWPNPQPIATNYLQEIGYLKNWLEARLSWLDANVPNTGACYEYPVSEPSNILVKIFPVPLQTITFIEVASRNSQTLDLQVIDMLGRTLVSKRTFLSPGMNKININTVSWGKGLYVVRMRTNKGDKFQRKLVK